MRMLLVGAGGFQNRGSEAIVLCTISLLQDRFPDCEIKVSSHRADVDARRSPSGVEFIHAHWEALSFPAKVVRRLWSTLTPRARVHRETQKAIGWADVVLSVGGDNYTADYGHPRYFISLNRLVKQTGKPLVLWGASIGPFVVEGRVCQPLVEAVRLADLITARDSETVAELAKYGMGSKVHQVVDPAFILRPAEEVPAYRRTSERMVGVNVSPLIARTDEGFRGRVEGLVAAVQRLVDEQGFSVLLIPHVTTIPGQQGDERPLELLREYVDREGRVEALPYDLDARQLKAVIAEMDLLIAGRTHATIAGFSSGVPTVSIAYSRKARGLNQLLFGHTDYVLPRERLSEREAVEAVVQRVVEKGPEIRARLQSMLPGMIEELRASAGLVAEVVGEAGG